MLKLFNSSNRPRWHVSHLIRRCKITVQTDPVATTNSEKTSEKSLTSNMRKYFEKHELTEIARQAPEKYLKRSQKLIYCTVLDPELAKRIVFSICSRLEGEYVVESDPGFGFMSRVLVSVVPNLILCERSEDFRSKLKDFEMKHENVHINEFNVPTLLMMIISTQQEPLKPVTDFYQDILSRRKSNGSPRINWIFSSLTINAIKTLCMIHLCESSFQQLGKMTYYITLPSTLYKVLSQPLSDEIGNRDALVAVLFQIVFDHEILMTGIPRKKFLPWPRLKDTDEELFLIRVTPKDNVENLFDSDLLARSFIKFLQVGLKKKRRVIPLLEKYVNNCGPLFILEHDLTIYTEFFELSSEKILSLFLSFSKLPEFSYSTFIDDVQDEYSDEPEAGEKKLNDEETNNFEVLSESEDEEENQSEDAESNKLNENLEHFLNEWIISSASVKLIQSI